jgi:HD-GYP domain-containing protein (c-di-GMP phosphodiesterase class II)
MAEHLALPAYAVRDQGRTGLLYDIGKLAISNRILDKPGPLIHAEYAQVKQHPRLTYEVLTRVAPFRGIAEVAASHHEKLDGTGYHRGMTAEDLSVPSRILAVADVLSQDRPYRPAMPMEKVLAILDEESGEKLCPRCVGTLNELVSKGDL